MSESQVELKESIGASWAQYRERMPEFAQAYDAIAAEAYAGGSIGAKHKRLMALCAAMIKGCRACILYQADNAIEQGATLDEFLETIAVATALGGTMGAAEATRLMQFLEERGMLD